MAWRWFQLGLISQINVGSSPTPATRVLYLLFDAVVQSYFKLHMQSAKGYLDVVRPMIPKSVNTHITLKIEFGSYTGLEMRVRIIDVINNPLTKDSQITNKERIYYNRSGCKCYIRHWTLKKHTCSIFPV